MDMSCVCSPRSLCRFHEKEEERLAAHGTPQELNAMRRANALRCEERREWWELSKEITRHVKQLNSMQDQWHSRPMHAEEHRGYWVLPGQIKRMEADLAALRAKLEVLNAG